MANSAQSPIPSASFQIPFEPHPIPYLPTDDEEESFVVLGKSLTDLDLGESPGPVVDKSIVEELRSLIKDELKEIADDAEQQADSVRTTTTQVEQNTTDLLDGLLSMTSTNSTDLIQTKLEEIIQENNRLKETIIQNNMSMKNQYERIQAWQKDVQEVHKAHKDKLFEAKEIIDKLKKDNDSLTSSMESLKKENEQKESEVKSLAKNDAIDKMIEDLKQDNEGLKSAMELYKKESEAKSEEIMAVRESIKKKSVIEREISTKASANMGQFELDLANNKIKDLECLREKLVKEKQELMTELDELKANCSSLAESELTVNMLQREIVLAKKQNECFQSQLADANQQIYILSHQNITRKQSEDYDTIRDQLMNAQMTITDLQQEKVTIMNDILAKDQELKVQNDKVFALEAQLDVFKGDFEAERSAKEGLKAEKDQMAQDLQHLQRRNQQMQEEIEVLRERNFEYVPARASSRSEAHGSVNSTTLKCPICQFGFNTFQALENHVDRCVDMHEAMP